MLCKPACFCVSIGLLLLILGRTSAQPQDRSIRWYDSISVDGFLSMAYTVNFNRPDTMKNFYRVFDFDGGSMKIDVAELVLRKDALRSGDLGFRADCTIGSSIPQIARSSGLNTGDIDMHQLYVRCRLPAGEWSIDAGKFITSLGYEVIEGYDGYNDNYSRSFLFGYAIPFTHTGLRASGMLSESVSANVMLVNGWDVAIDNNSSKTIGAQIGWVPAGGMNITLGTLFGSEKPGNNADNRRILDITGSCTLNDRITLGINGDYAAEDHSADDHGTAVWDGCAAYLRVNLNTVFSLTGRGELFEDRDGLRTGVRQRLREITLTPEFRAAEHLRVRADFRIDSSDMDVFQSDSGWKNTQGTIGINLLASF